MSKLKIEKIVFYNGSKGGFKNSIIKIKSKQNILKSTPTKIYSLYEISTSENLLKLYFDFMMSKFHS